jgi:WD40 repeat protein
MAGRTSPCQRAVVLLQGVRNFHDESVCMTWHLCSDEEAGPAPPPGMEKPKKKRKVLEFQQVYLDNLPCATLYERSFMHQNTVTHVHWTKNQFLVTGSSDGHVKFWKKKAGEIEFIKRYCAHMGPVTGLATSKDGTHGPLFQGLDAMA